MKMMTKHSLQILILLSILISSAWAGSCRYNPSGCGDKEESPTADNLPPSFENTMLHISGQNSSLPNRANYQSGEAGDDQYESDLEGFCSFLDADNYKKMNDKGMQCSDVHSIVSDDLDTFRDKGWKFLAASWRAQLESSVYGYISVSGAKEVKSSCSLYNIAKVNDPKQLHKSLSSAYKHLAESASDKREDELILNECSDMFNVTKDDKGNITDVQLKHTDSVDGVIGHVFGSSPTQLVESMNESARLSLGQATSQKMCVPHNVYSKLSTLPSIKELELLAKKPQLFSVENIQNVFENARKGDAGYINLSDDVDTEEDLVYKLLSRDPRLRLIMLGPDDDSKYNEALKVKLAALKTSLISRLQNSFNGKKPSASIEDLSSIIADYGQYLNENKIDLDFAFDHKCIEMEISLLKMVCSARDYADQGVEKSIDSVVFNKDFIESLPNDMTGGDYDNDGMQGGGKLDAAIGERGSCSAPINGRTPICLSRSYETIFCDNHHREKLAGESSMVHSTVPVATLNMRSMTANPLLAKYTEGHERSVEDYNNDLSDFDPNDSIGYKNFCSKYSSSCEESAQYGEWDSQCFQSMYTSDSKIDLTGNPDLVRMFDACKLNPDMSVCEYLKQITQRGPTTISISVDEDYEKSFESLADDRGITDHSFSSVVSELSAGEAKNLKNTSNEDSIVKTENAWDFDFGVESLNDLNINNETDYSKIATTVQSAMSNVDTKLASEQKKLEDTKVEHSKVIEELSDANLDDDRRSELEAQKNMFEQRMKSSEATIAQLISQRDDLTKLIDDLNKKIDNKQSPTIVSDNNSQVVNNGQNTRIVAGTTSSGDNHAQPDHISNNTQSVPQFNVGTSNGSALDGREQSAGGINFASNNFNMGIGYLTRKQMEQYETQLRSKAIPMNVDDLLQVSDPQKLKELLSKFGLDNENEFYIFDEAQKAYIKVDGHSIVDGKIVYKIGGKLAAVETDKHVNREPANAPQIKPVDNPSDRAFFLDKLKEIMKGN